MTAVVQVGDADGISYFKASEQDRKHECKGPFRGKMCGGHH